MMDQRIEKIIDCPYCGEHIHLLIDVSDAGQTYIEDCQVCCRPINILVNIATATDSDTNRYSDDEIIVTVTHEDE